MSFVRAVRVRALRVSMRVLQIQTALHLTCRTTLLIILYSAVLYWYSTGIYMYLFDSGLILDWYCMVPYFYDCYCSPCTPSKKPFLCQSAQLLLLVKTGILVSVQLQLISCYSKSQLYHPRCKGSRELV